MLCCTGTREINIFFCEYVFVTRNCTLCIKRNTVTQGCPVVVFNEEMTLGKLLTGKKGHRTEKLGCLII